MNLADHLADPNTLYKSLDVAGRSTYQSFQWKLPNGAAAKWMPEWTGTIEPCEGGYHFCRAPNLLDWIGPVLYIGEGAGESAHDDSKITFSRARLLCCVETWNEKSARLFACDCAERVVHLCGDDPRPRKAIEVARRFANDETSQDELRTAWDAARAAAWDAAWDAARDAAWDAARAAARDAAQKAEQKAQRVKLTQLIQALKP